jgi:basic amino acid/polyamine antiporter, APA family
MPTASEGPDQESPAKHLGLVHVFAIGAGAMFSSGFFLLPGLAADQTGPSLPLAYLLAGVLVLPTMLSVTELAVAMPLAGGPYHFFRRALGPSAATVGALGLWVALVLKSSFALVGIDAYLGIVWNLPDASVGLGLAVAFTVLNLAGARESATIQVGLVGVLLLVLGGFLVAGGVDAAGTGASELADRFSPLFTNGFLGLLSATGMVFVAFAGLPQVASVAGSIRDPSRTIPRGILAALATATTIYVGGTALVILAVPRDQLRGDDTPIATAAEAFQMPLGVTLIVVAALAAFASTANAGVMSASRYPLALALDGLAWRRFARLSSNGVPRWSVVLSGGAIALIVWAVDVEDIAKLGSSFILLSFGLLNASVLVLRRSRVPDYQPSFRVPWYPWVPWIGVITSVVLVADLGLLPAAATFGLIAAGAGWYRWAARSSDDVPGVVLWRYRRRHQHIDAEALERLEEHGPRSDDRAPEILEGLTAERVTIADGDRADAALRDAAAEALARVERIDVRDARRWLSSADHPVLHTPDQAAEIHLIRFDSPGDDTVIVVWAPDDLDEPDEGNGSDGDHPTEPRGPTMAVVAGSAADHERLARLTALLTSQLADDDLAQAWPCEPEHVGPVLAGDAARRQGADPSRS